MTKTKAPEIASPSDDVNCWREQDSSIMLKAVTPFGDPVELTADDARAIALMLLGLAEQLEPMSDKNAESGTATFGSDSELATSNSPAPTAALSGHET